MRKTRFSKLGLFFACLGILALCVLAVSLLNRQSMVTALKLLFFQVCCMLLPGCALLKLVRFRCNNVIQLFGFSYAAGYCLNILTYFAAVPLSRFMSHWMIAIRIINLALGGASLAYLAVGLIRNPRLFWKRLGVREALSTADIRTALIAWIGVFALSFLAYGLPNRLPNLGSEQAYYFDTLYWIGNALSLSRGFPPESMRGSGYILQYHYLSGVQLASIQKTVDIPVSVLGLGYTSVQSAALLFFGLYCLFREVLRDRRRIALGILLAFSLGDIARTNNNTMSHLITAPFGYDYGFALSCFGVVLLIRLHRADRLLLKESLLFMALLAICVGTKAPNGLLLLGFEGVLCLMWLFDRRKRWPTFALGAISVVLCLGVYLVFMGNAQAWVGQAANASKSAEAGESASSGLRLTLEGTSNYSTIVRQWYNDRFQNANLLTRAVLAIRIILQYCFRTNMAICFLVAWSVVSMLRHRRADNSVPLACLAVLAAGAALALFIPMVGYSQCYLIQGASVYGILLGLYPYESEAAPSTWTRLRRWIAIPLIIACLFNTYNYVQPVVAGALETMKTGELTPLSPQFADANPSGLVTPLESEGYDWIREHTSDDAILITNATVYATSPLMTDVFAERRCWVESQKSPSVDRVTADFRIDLILRFFCNYSKRAYEVMREEGVDYAIVLTRFETGNEYTSDLQCVYENQDIKVYAL